QTPETNNSSAGASPGPASSLQSLSPRSSSSTSSNSCQSPDIDWVDTFMIPWDKFPEELMQSLERGTRSSPRMRREMVRIVACEMMRKSSCISKRNSTELAKKIVAKYPKSSARHNRGRHKVPPEQRAAIQDTSGCINWDLKFLPLGEIAESQQEKKEKLKMMSQQTDANPEEVKLLMKLTFYTQRKQVNQGKDIKYLLEEWPFWFDGLGMEVHFKELTGIGLKETFTRNVNLKGKRLLNYMHTVCVNKKRKFLQAVTKFKVMRGELNGCSEDVKEMVLFLLSYFDEKEDAMFCYVDDTCLAGEVQMDQVHLTPTVVVCGQSCYSSRRFTLSVDRNVVHDNIPSFISALCMMFGSYYSFNIHYPSELASTLEFLQSGEKPIIRGLVSKWKVLELPNMAHIETPHSDNLAIVPKKAHPKELNDYRPVALTSHVMKTMEPLLLNHLRPQVHHCSLRTGRRWEWKMPSSNFYTELTLIWTRGGGAVRVMFFDFSSAFNTIHPLLLRDKLMKMEVDMHLVTWITDYLTGRPQHVRIRDCSSDTVISSTGAPQGTVLSPVLFTLYTSDFKYNSELCHMQKFSDDTAIVGCVHNGQEREYRSLVDFVEWCTTNHLKLNITKTREMCIDFRRSRPSQQPISINGVDVEVVRSYRYLAVHLDERLDWSVNTDTVYKKAQSRLYFLRRLGSETPADVLPVCGGQSSMLWRQYQQEGCWMTRQAGRTDLYRLDNGTLTAIRYQDEILEPAGAVGPGFLLVHNNARPHVARVCRQFLENEGIDTIDWPTGSPDLNPIELLWDIPFRSIRGHQVALVMTWSRSGRRSPRIPSVVSLGACGGLTNY
ncbi:hypothetical protein NFI96_018878, partial [Prochilodus magdalenae]